MGTDPPNGPEGFQHWGLDADGLLAQEQDGRVFAESLPSLNFVVIYPPLEESLSALETTFQWYQLAIIAVREDTLHGAYTQTGAIRNMHLLEQAANKAVFDGSHESPELLLRDVVQYERERETLFRGMTELIETHDKFQTVQLMTRGDPHPIVDHLLTQIERESGLDREDIIDRTLEQYTSSDSEVVDADIYENLVWLLAETESSRTVAESVVLALDSPYWSSSLPTLPQYKMPAAEFDFIGRFERIIDVLRDQPADELTDCDPERLREIVIEESSVEVAPGVAWETPSDQSLPVLDTVARVSELRDEHSIPAVFPLEGEDITRDLFRFVKEQLFQIYGAAACDGMWLMRNPYVCDVFEQIPVPIGGEAYARRWAEHYVHWCLVKQLIDRTVDNKQFSIRHPFAKFDDQSLEETGDWDSSVDRVEELVESLSEIDVHDETEPSK